MTLNELSLPVTYEWGVSHALVFGAPLAARLAEIHLRHGDRRHVPSPRKLIDGRYMLPADILTECMPGGIMHDGFSRLDSKRFAEIYVVPIQQVLPMLDQQSQP